MIIYKDIMDWLSTKPHVRITFDKSLDWGHYVMISIEIKHSKQSNNNNHLEKRFILKRLINISYSDKAVSNILDEMYQYILSTME